MLSDTQTAQNYGEVGGVLALSEAMTEYAYAQSEPSDTTEVFDQPVLDAVRACD